MANTVLLEVVTPDRKVMSQDVEYVGAPGIEGEFGVLPNHIPFLSALGIGNLYYKDAGKAHFVFVAGGFADVTGDKVTILAEVAEKAEEIDIDRAKRAHERANARLAKTKDDVDYARARAALERAITRINAGDRAGTPR